MSFYNIIQRFSHWCFGPTSRFKVGDSVQLHSGGYLMVVVEVNTGRKLKVPLIGCQWYEPEFKRSRFNLFRETRLQPFDWWSNGSNTTSRMPNADHAMEDKSLAHSAQIIANS